MRFQAIIEINVERTEGKFASADEIQDGIHMMLDNANYGSIDGIGSDGTSSYEITDWEVDVNHIPSKSKKGRK